MRKDIDFNFTPHPLTGDLSTKTESSAIVQSLRNIIETSYYERGFNVGFGSSVRSSLFELFTPLDVLTLKDSIIQAIRNYEPMVEVVDVEVGFTDSDESNLNVSIIYTERNNPTPRTLTMQLERLR